MSRAEETGMPPARKYTELVEKPISLRSQIILSVDVEDYYNYVPNGEDVYQTYNLESRIEANLDRLLSLFEEKNCTCTFFVLSSLAHRIVPHLRRISDAGHEIASHGHGHEHIARLTPEAFNDDINLSKRILEDITGRRVDGYRAPMFSITDNTTWALDLLGEAGYRYDSSVCPVSNFAYGIPDAPENPHVLTNGMVEIPMSSKRLLGYQFLVSGGFYLRAYPFWLLRFLIGQRDSKLPLVLYVHPWEWEDRKYNLWEMGVKHPYLNYRPKLMKFITTYNRRSAFGRFSKLVAGLENPVSMREAIAT